MNKTAIKNTLNLLNLYKESGVDELISSRPKNRTVRKTVSYTHLTLPTNREV